MPARLGEGGNTNSYSSDRIHEEFMLNEREEVIVEERGEVLPMVGVTSSNTGGPSTATGYGQPSTTSWRSPEGDDEDDEIDVDENSELNRHRRNETSSPSSNGINRNGDGGESGHHVGDLDEEDEKSFKYYKELPDHTKLYNAKKRAPGFRVIGAGLVVLAGLGYLIAYLCTSVSVLSSATLFVQPAYLTFSTVHLQITRYSHVTKVRIIYLQPCWHSFLLT